VSVLELFFRTAACTQLLLLFLFLLSQSGRAPAALFFLSIASYLLAPLVLRDWLWGAWAFPVLIMALLVPAFFCVFIGSVFLEGRLSVKRLLPLLALTAVVGLVAYSTAMGTLVFGDPRYWQWLAQLLKAIWGCAGLAIAFKDWQTDLVEPRRRLRMVILGGAGAYILGVLVVELLIAQQAEAWLELANVSLILVLVTLFCRYTLALSPQNILTKMQDTPLLTLALDAGFRSLAPFNKAFKENFSVTPSEYRVQHQGKP
jgi:AraC-like DNA-binding protein